MRWTILYFVVGSLAASIEKIRDHQINEENVGKVEMLLRTAEVANHFEAASHSLRQRQPDNC